MAAIREQYRLKTSATESETMAQICRHVALRLREFNLTNFKRIGPFIIHNDVRTEELTSARKIICEGYACAANATDTEVLSSIARIGLEVVCYLHERSVAFPVRVVLLSTPYPNR